MSAIAELSLRPIWSVMLDQDEAGKRSREESLTGI